MVGPHWPGPSRLPVASCSSEALRAELRKMDSGMDVFGTDVVAGQPPQFKKYLIDPRLPS